MRKLGKINLRKCYTHVTRHKGVLCKAYEIIHVDSKSYTDLCHYYIYTLIWRIHNEVLLFWLLRHRESSTFVKPLLAITCFNLSKTTHFYIKSTLVRFSFKVKPSDNETGNNTFYTVFLLMQMIGCSFELDADYNSTPPTPFLTKQHKPYTRFHTLPERKEWPHSKESDSKWITKLKTCGL